MIRGRSRVVLPLGHFLVDVVVLVLWVWHSQDLFRQTKGAVWFQPVAMLQENAPQFEPKFDISPPGQYLLLALGNLPAMVVSENVRPRAWYQSRTKLWDPWWFLIHESVASLVWFGLGMYGDSGRLRLSKAIERFLIMRCLVTPFVNIGWAARLGVLAEGLFWMGLIVHFIARGVKWGYRLVHR